MFGGDSVGKEAASKQATRHDETNSLLREGNYIARSSLRHLPPCSPATVHSHHRGYRTSSIGDGQRGARL